MRTQAHKDSVLYASLCTFMRVNFVVEVKLCAAHQLSCSVLQAIFRGLLKLQSNAKRQTPL